MEDSDNLWTDSFQGAPVCHTVIPLCVGEWGGWRTGDLGPPLIPKSINAHVPDSPCSMPVGLTSLNTEVWLYLYLILNFKKMIKWIIFDGRVTWFKVINKCRLIRLIHFIMRRYGKSLNSSVLGSEHLWT